MTVPGDGRAERAREILTDRVAGRVEVEGDRLRITSDRGAQVLIDVLRGLDGEGLEPESLTVREPSLDDVFLALTGHHAESEEEPGAPGKHTRRKKRGEAA
jgi:hypothetical protein